MTVSLDLLRTFLAVHRSSSLTAAAGLLGLSQPAVTAHVKALESTLDAQLFVRQARGVTPTAAADELARAIARPLDNLESALHPAADRYSRTVLLGGPSELLTEVALPSLAPLLQEGLRLRVSFGLADELLADLGVGRLDLVVSTVRPRRRGVRAEAAFDEEFVLVGAPGQSLDAPMISYAEDLPIIRRYWRTVFGKAPSMDAQVVVPDLRAVLALVLAGVGVSVLPRYLCSTQLAGGELVILHEPDLAPINTGYVAWRDGALAHSAVATVQARLLEHLRQM